MVRKPSQVSISTQIPQQRERYTNADGAPVAFGYLLRSHRKQRGLSLAQFSTLVHFDRGHISKIETGKRNPSVAFAEACDRALSTGNTFTTIALTLESATRQQQGWVQPAQLPAAIPHFVGRAEQLSCLDRLLLDQEQSLATPVGVISGPPGVGKTALAVQWAHQAVNDGHFADGQLFVDLQGAGKKASPFDILAGLLHALGVPADRIPETLEQRSAALRSHLHGRKMLLLLDNAADAQQVYSLLPGSPRCAVVVTSRSWLPGLMSKAGTVPLLLTELHRSDAIRLIREIIGETRADTYPAAASTIVEHCGYFPLALVLACERIVHHQYRGADVSTADLNLTEEDVALHHAFETSYGILRD
ncbi:helix-turn-helix domain-containing protein [Nocardiopsis sp. FIRDI 009]|uniref:helix-turn-helix domain-containing protein n=1 Tax=Nocardiopsis sp. FIRDI 009 TaxID=714197 RepID=UPI000E2541A9|nr:helix-turn-helix domain-containing protein [Nocardiopsis sp. FIRDI 009]